MPHRVWSVRRGHQSFHTQQGLLQRGTALDKAENIGHMGSHRGQGRPTRDQLYKEAKDLNIRGRSMMNKDELRRAVDHKASR